MKQWHCLPTFSIPYLAKFTLVGNNTTKDHGKEKTNYVHPQASKLAEEAAKAEAERLAKLQAREQAQENAAKAAEEKAKALGTTSGEGFLQKIDPQKLKTNKQRGNQQWF